MVMRMMAAVVFSVMLATLMGTATLAQPERDLEMIDVPGGGTVSTPDNFTWSPPLLLLDPTDFVLFLRGRRTNIGGNTTFRAALAVGNMSAVQEPFLPRVAGKLPDADWVTVTHYEPAWGQPEAGAWAPLMVTGADEARIFRLNVRASGFLGFGTREIDGFVAEASVKDRHAVLFGMLSDYDEAEAAALLAQALSREP